MTIMSTPEPLWRCPGLKYWQPYFKSPYLVFVDESFRGFFEFDTRGYFAHSAVGVPEPRYELLRTELGLLLDEYRRLTSVGATEFKHTDFKRIAYVDRRRLTLIQKAFRANGVFISVFYTPLRSFVLERVRTNLFRAGRREVPTDFQGLYDEAKAELQNQAHGPGQAGLIGKLLLLPVAAVANLLATLKCPFQLVYDPRDPKEDKMVLAKVEGLIAAMKHLKGKGTKLRWDLSLYMKRVIYDRRSEDELGLQMADLMAGEARAFFDANAELMDFRASPTLVTQGSFEPLVVGEEVQGTLHKTGALYKIPAVLRKRCFTSDRDGKTILPLLRELFGAGVVTCYSSWGQPRHVLAFDGYVFDQLE
jgi:hypothetical protein